VTAHQWGRIDADGNITRTPRPWGRMVWRFALGWLAVFLALYVAIIIVTDVVTHL